jgi:multiple sugar transport system substrate-binding protein
MASGRRMTRRGVLRLIGLAGGAAAGSAALAACGATPTPQVVERVVTQIVAGTPQVVKETVVVEQTVEKVVEQTVIVEKNVTAAAPTTSGQVSMWAFPLGEDDMGVLWNPLLQRFNQAYPNVKVSVELLPWDGRREKMMTAFAGGQAPSMAYVNTDTISLFGMNDVLLPLDDVIPQADWDDLTGNLLGGLVWQGKHLMYPCLVIAEGELYNKGLCKELGWDPAKAPYTWDDFRQLGALGKPKGLYVDLANTADWDTFIEYLWQAGGNVFDKDVTKCTLNSDAGKAAVAFYKEEFDNGWVPKEGAVGTAAESSALTVNYWIDGKQILSGHGNADITTNTAKQAPDIEFDICPSFKDKVQVQGGSNGCWGIFKSTKDMDPIKAWLLWLIQPEQQGFYGSVTKFAPPRTSAMPFWAAEPMAKKFTEIRMPYLMMNQDNNYFYQESATIWGPYMQAAILGQQSIDEAMNGAAAEIQKLVDEWNAKRSG